MKELYLISSEEDGIDVFYTVDENNKFIKIGNTINWDKAFDAETLNTIEDYTSFNKPKVWVNSTEMRASIIPAGGIIKSTDYTAINTNAFSGISSMGFGVSEGNSLRMAFSFDGRNTFYTLVDGKTASSTVYIPEDPTKRTGMNLVLPAEELFDGKEETKKTYPSTGDVEVPVTIENTPVIIRGYKCRISDDSRYPVIVKFYAHDNDKNSWVLLDEVRIHAGRRLDRYFENSITTSSYKWVFSFEETTDLVNNAKDFELCYLNLYAEVDGKTWVTCTEEELPTKGATYNTLYYVNNTETYSRIFKPGQMDYMFWNKAGHKLSNFTVNFISNSAPYVYDTDITNTNSQIHANSFKFKFRIYDAEVNRVSWNVYVNGALAKSGYNAKHMEYIDVEIPNRFFTNICAPNETGGDKGRNIVRIETIDQYDSTGSNEYTVLKVNNGAVMVGALQGNDYIFQIGDPDKDRVKYTAYVNSRKIVETGFERVPIDGVITFKAGDIYIGRENTLTMVLTDELGTDSIYKETFIGTYGGLLFLDRDNDLLSTDKGDVLKKVNYGNLLLGSETVPVEISIQNKSGTLVYNPNIKSPKDINGVDTKMYNSDGVYTHTEHKEGDIYLQLSSNDKFSNPAEYYNLTLQSLAPNSKATFYTRLVSKNPAAESGKKEFDISGSATTV